MFSATVLSYNNLKSWKTNPIFLLKYGTSLSFNLPKSREFIFIIPSVGSSSFITNFKNVDLPEPDGPTKNTNSPFSIFKQTLSKLLLHDHIFLLPL